MKKLVSGVKGFWRGFSYLESARKTYLFGVILSSFEWALLFVTPYISEILIDIVTGVREGNILHTLWLLFLVFLLFVPPVIFGKYLQRVSVAKGTANLRKRLFFHILRLPYEKTVQYRTGDFITRLTDDVNRTVGVFESFAVSCLLRFAVVFSVTLVLLLWSDWRIAVAALVYSTISLVCSILLNPYVKRLEQEAKVETVNSASFLIETLRGIPIIRVFTLQSVLAERYRRICEAIRTKRIRFNTINGIAYGVIDFFTFSAQAVGFIIGVLLALDSASLGNAVFNASLMGLMADSMLRLGTFLLLIQPDLVSMERVYEILDTKTENYNETIGIRYPQEDTAVELDDLRFAYQKSTVLDGISITVHRGEHLAIVGGSGGGKSTLLRLIEGFYKPQSGEIRYFGKSVKEMSAVDVRALFSYIPQECTLFDGTIGENILMGRPTASMEEVREAARLAQIDRFIESLPAGYDTAVGERGSQLSGGQKQRIAIARAILKRARVLLLDEATAALDTATEREVQACLDTVSQGMTTVTVAHRLSTIQNADRILVMENGKVVEEGKFDELLTFDGRFKELYESQQRENETVLGREKV